LTSAREASWKSGARFSPVAGLTAWKTVPPVAPVWPARRLRPRREEDMEELEKRRGREGEAERED
jgi:hypothetical protein